jgi:hypothetical protein
MAKWKKYSKAETEEDRGGQKDILAEKATAIAEERNKTMEKIMKQLRLREDQKRSVTQIKIVRGKL